VPPLSRRLTHVEAVHYNRIARGLVLTGNPPMASGVAVGLPVARFVGGLNAAIPAIRRILATRRAGTGSIGVSGVAIAQVTLLWPVHNAVPAVGCVLAIPGAAAIGAIVDAIIAGLIAVDHAIATMDSAISIAGTLIGTVISTVIALFSRVDNAVAARAQRYPTQAVLPARTRLHGIRSIIALFAKLTIDGLVSTVWGWLALVRAKPDAVGR